MIISHKHKYLFVEIPHTGTTTIREELCEHYDGQSILWRHSYYSDFLRRASSEERKYFVFCSIRNPLDVTVSQYFRMVTNHHEIYTNPEITKKRSSRDQRRERTLYEALQKSRLDFQTYFLKFYNRPYNSWASLMVGKFDYLIRFENLQEDFAQLLNHLGLEPKRPLPVRNSTREREKDFRSYYTPEIIPRVKQVFGPFMKQWGYQFPPEWGEAPIAWQQQLVFDVLTVFKKMKWTYLRFFYYYPQR
jgi:sulfotransferase famil protein